MYAFITPLITWFDFLRALADLSFGVPSAGNPSRVQADICQLGKRPIEEIADHVGKVTLVPNLSCLF